LKFEMECACDEINSRHCQYHQELADLRKENEELKFEIARCQDIAEDKLYHATRSAEDKWYIELTKKDKTIQELTSAIDIYEWKLADAATTIFELRNENKILESAKKKQGN